MYQCSECGGFYDLSEENEKLIPVEHIIECPHCKNRTHVIGADVDHVYGDGVKPAYLMYSRGRKLDDYNNLQVVVGKVVVGENYKKDVMLEIRSIIKKHTDKLNIMKDNLSRWEEEKWTDAEIRECDKMIGMLASILSDLNRALKENS